MARTIKKSDSTESATTISISSMSPTQLVYLFQRCGASDITVDSIQRDIDAGAPTNPDGTINLTHYVAWLIREYQK